MKIVDKAEKTNEQILQMVEAENGDCLICRKQPNSVHIWDPDGSDIRIPEGIIFIFTLCSDHDMNESCIPELSDTCVSSYYHLISLKQVMGEKKPCLQ